MESFTQISKAYVITAFLAMYQHNHSHPQHNILISEERNPLLCDFGISRLTTTTTSTTTRGSTPWMAKELFLGSPDNLSLKHDERSDIWALGMVIYVRQIPSRHCTIYNNRAPSNITLGTTKLEHTLLPVPKSYVRYYSR